MKLSRSQRLMKLFSSKKRFEAIQKESMEWKFTCTSCNKETSVWDIGGVRYMAKGNPKMRIKCPKCGENVTVELIHEESSL